MVRKRKDGHDDQRFKDAWSDKYGKEEDGPGGWLGCLIFILIVGYVLFSSIGNL